MSYILPSLKTNFSNLRKKKKNVLTVIMPTAPFHNLISGSVSFPSFTPFTPIFPFSFMSCPVCANSGARRLHRHDDVIQTISPTFGGESHGWPDSEGARSLARLKTGYSRFSSTHFLNTDIKSDTHFRCFMVENFLLSRTKPSGKTGHR